MTSERIRAALQIGILALLILAPLPFGSVQPGAVLAIELSAAVLGLGTILLLGRDENARAAVPRAPLAICGVVIALGILQVVPLPFSIAEQFNPTADLMRPVIPYLGLDHPPTVSWSVAAPETTDALLRFVAYVLIGLTAAIAFDTERSRRRFAVVLVAAAVFQAVYGSGEYLTGRQHIFGFAKRYYLDSATGTFINRNHFATMLAIALPFALTLAIPRPADHRGSGWRQRLVGLSSAPALTRLFAGLASAVIWMGLLLSHSRAGLAAALVGGAIVLIHFRGMRAARWTGAIAAGVLILLLSSQLAQAPGERYFTAKNDLEARGGRFTVWRDAMSLVVARPILGWGFGTFESAFPMVQSEGVEQLYDHAHNDWIEWTTEGGVVALCSALALLMMTLFSVRRGGGLKALEASAAVASRASIIAVALHALWDFALRIPAVSLIGATVLGVAMGIGIRSSPSGSGAVFGKQLWRSRSTRPHPVP